MLAKHLKKYHLILASGSPRRQQFLKDLGLNFEIRLKRVAEVYPTPLPPAAVAEYLAELKADPYLNELRPKDLLITGDTLVCLDNDILGKPESPEEAAEMLKKLSGQTHQVISAVSLRSKRKKTTFHGLTEVCFKPLKKEEIDYYITQFKPFDKAGAYGIQEWIGKIGITDIQGSYYNVMGMPVDKLYAQLMSF